MTATLEAPEVQAQPAVTEVTDEVRKEIVAQREQGMTLAELRKAHPGLSSEQIRDALPAGNARERQARAKADHKPKTTETTTQGVGGRSGTTKSQPKGKAKQTEEPKRAPAPRYASDLGDLPDRVVAARKLLGRKDLSEALGLGQSATWRAEQGRVHPKELEALTAALAKVEKRIAAGEFQKATRERQPAVSKADLIHRIEAVVTFVQGARSDKRVTKSGLIDAVLAVLDPSLDDRPRQVCAVCEVGWPTSSTPPAHSTPGAQGPAGTTHEFVLKS
jgi:hypothetical protein